MILAIADNLNLEDSINQATGIALGVIFIIWSFGLAFTLYSFFTNEEPENKTIKTNLILF